MSSKITKQRMTVLGVYNRPDVKPRPTTVASKRCDELLRKLYQPQMVAKAEQQTKVPVPSTVVVDANVASFVDSRVMSLQGRKRRMTMHGVHGRPDVRLKKRRLSTAASKRCDELLDASYRAQTVVKSEQQLEFPDQQPELPVPSTVVMLAANVPSFVKQYWQFRTDAVQHD